jgi:hypothetical protein
MHQKLLLWSGQSSSVTHLKGNQKEAFLYWKRAYPMKIISWTRSVQLIWYLGFYGTMYHYHHMIQPTISLEMSVKKHFYIENKNEVLSNICWSTSFVSSPIYFCSDNIISGKATFWLDAVSLMTNKTRTWCAECHN